MKEGFNRLGRSKSPYLLQHAAQPIWWWEWCPEAFDHARALDIPIFLSIGYSTCHWCHVMARESFDDPDVAEHLNRCFVSIKVDREEHPDIDDRFMAVCQFQTGSGGWPLSIFLTPDGVPFYAATYLPRHARNGMPGIIEVLDRISLAWGEQRSLVQRNASLLSGGLSRHFESKPGDFPRRETFIAAWESLQRTLDTEWGGFALAPKFPSPFKLRFLTRVYHFLGDPLARDVLVTTLERMMQGGIRDQIGGGYHRYAVDRQWRIPHFEKMLYDQALLLSVFCEAYLLTGRDDFLDEAGSIVRYVTRDLTSPEGVFHAAEDADSEGEEGKFYLWTRDEIVRHLGVTDGTIVAECLGILPSGGWGDRFVPRRLPVGEIASRHGMTPEELSARIPVWIDTLRHARDQRPRPFRDTKVITEWNGLMIAALAEYSSLAGDEAAWSGAVRAFDWFMERERREGGLARIWYGGERGVTPLLNDYAAIIGAALSLYQGSFEPHYLEHAIRLIDHSEGVWLFPSPGDDRGGDAGRGESLIPYDAIVPPPVSLAAQTYGILARITGDERYRMKGESLFVRYGGKIADRPVTFLSMLLAAEYYDDRAPTISLPLSPPIQPAVMGGYRLVGFMPGTVWKPSTSGSGALCSGWVCHGRFASRSELETLLSRFSFIDSRTEAG
ncbi:MAG: thioredoxin domain-containing protein [Desulfuromonadia bacterium]